MASSMIDALLAGQRIAKHEGPGMHPGTGTPQTVHRSGTVGPRAWAAALNDPDSHALWFEDDIDPGLNRGRFYDVFNRQPGLERFLDAVKFWSLGGVTRQRESDRLNRTAPVEARDRLVAYERDNANLLLRTVANAPRNAPTLWRALSVQGVRRNFDEVFPRGSEFSLNGLASFSEEEDFVTRWGRPGDVIFKVRPGAKGLNIATLSSLPDQKEWVTGGTYRVVNDEMERASGVIELVQTAGPKQSVRKRDDRDRDRQHILDLLMTPLPKERVSKHDGPGPHDTGTPQAVHAGGGITTPFGMETLSETIQSAILKTIGKREQAHGVDLSESTLVGRLRGLWDRNLKEDRDRFESERRWYHGANAYGTAVGEAYGADERKASGILAALSPQTGWGRNQDMAADLMGLLYEDPVVIRPNTNRRVRLSELTSEEVSHLLVGLDHPSMRVQTGARRGQPTRLFDQSTDNLTKSIRIYRGEDVGDVLGGSKVRSFFNNIFLPNQKTSWTDDTHMKRIWLDDPKVVSDDKKIRDLWSPAPKNASLGYDSGLYPYFVSVGGEAADELGVLPHEVQAVTWNQWRRETGSSGRDERRGTTDVDTIVAQLNDEFRSSPL